MAVPVAERPRSRTALDWLLPSCRLRYLGMEICQIPNVSRPDKTITQDPKYDPHHHLHLRCQFHLCAPLLADSSL